MSTSQRISARAIAVDIEKDRQRSEKGQTVLEMRNRCRKAGINKVGGSPLNRCTSIPGMQQALDERSLQPRDPWARIRRMDRPEIILQLELSGYKGKTRGVSRFTLQEILIKRLSRQAALAEASS